MTWRTRRAAVAGLHETSAGTIAAMRRAAHSIAFEPTVFAGGPMLQITVRGDADEGLIERMLASGDRSLAPPGAPASGLTLMSVEYDGPTQRAGRPTA